MHAIHRRAQPPRADFFHAPPRGFRFPVQITTDAPRSVLDLASSETVIDQGDQARSVFMIGDGEVMVSRQLADGRRQIVEILGAGGVFGVTSTSFHDASVETLCRAHIRAYDPMVIETSVRLRTEVAEALVTQLSDLHRHVVLLGRMSATEKVASYLSGLTFGRGWDLRARAPGGTMTVRLSMRQGDLADYLGLTSETVSRTFSGLRRLGVIAYTKPDLIDIVEPGRLVRLTGFLPTRTVP
jgi:CRP-like cAMP-binding protein